jgi:hypothetical protein
MVRVKQFFRENNGIIKVARIRKSGLSLLLGGKFNNMHIYIIRWPKSLE